MSLPEIIITGDGSHSLIDRERNETYHSIHGAVQESRHVFIRHGLEYWHERNNRPAVVFEAGFGTGLNALLAWEYSTRHRCAVHFETVEAFPLPEHIWRQLNYAEKLQLDEPFRRIQEAPWEAPYDLTASFTLKKRLADLRNMNLPRDSYDVIFYDAFAPSKQPEMWERPLLEKVCEAMRPGGVFVTYCATGQLKRDLKGIGLTVETLEGPPGKKEMVRGTRLRD